MRARGADRRAVLCVGVGFWLLLAPAICVDEGRAHAHWSDAHQSEAHHDAAVHSAGTEVLSGPGAHSECGDRSEFTVTGVPLFEVFPDTVGRGGEEPGGQADPTGSVMRFTRIRSGPRAPDLETLSALRI